jgi:hypothetical protein
LAVALAENALESERKEHTVGPFEHTPQYLYYDVDDPCFGSVESSWPCSGVAATGVTATTAAARQLLRGRPRFRGEWEQIPVVFWRAHCAASPVVTAWCAICRTGAGYRRPQEGAREARPEGPARRGTCPRGAEPGKRVLSREHQSKKTGEITLCRSWAPEHAGSTHLQKTTSSTSSITPENMCSTPKRLLSRPAEHSTRRATLRGSTRASSAELAHGQSVPRMT